MQQLDVQPMATIEVATWTSQELNTLGSAEEIEISPARNDGTLGKPVVVWVVRLGDDVYARSVNGPGAGWFTSVQGRHEGQVHARGVTKDVHFVDVRGPLNNHIDDAYRSKYRRYPAATLERITGAAARSATVRLLPRGN